MDGRSLGVVCHRVPPVEKRLNKDCFGVSSVEQGFLGLLQCYIGLEEAEMNRFF